MICPNCKRQIDDDSTHCMFCGANLRGKAQQDSKGVQGGNNIWEAPNSLNNNGNANNSNNGNNGNRGGNNGNRGGGQQEPDGPSGPKKRPPVKMPKILAPILLLVISLLLILAVVLLLVGKENKQNDPKSATTQRTEIEYNVKELEKKAPDISSVNGIMENTEQAERARTEIEMVEDSISQAEAEISARYPTVTEQTIGYYISAVRTKVREMYSKNLITGYNVNDTSIRIDLPSGGSYMYAPQIEGCDAGGGDVPTLKVATYQPCLSGYPESLSNIIRNVDDGAALIASSFDAYVFDSRGSSDDSDYNDSEVTVQECAQFGKYNVILWHGHGCCDSEYGPLMVIGIERNAENDAKYQEAINNRDMFYNDQYYFISSTFIDKYVEDNSLDNSIVYIGTCSSGKDERLARAFINKGAEAVYANSGTIHSEYNQRMIKSVSEGLCTKYDDDTYYTVEDALEYAYDKNGNRDTGECRNTEVRLISDNNNFALDWYIDKTAKERDIVVVLDTSGSMAGMPINETKQAAEKFVQTTLGEDAVIGLVTYSSNAKMECDFTRKENALTKVIDGISAGGGTNIDAALQKANDMLSKSDAEKKIIVLMSDGEPNDGRVGEELINYADSIKSNDTYIYTLGFFSDLSGTDKTSAQKLMEELASDGCHYEVEDADDLVFFFGDIADQINGQKYVYIRIACPVDVSVSHNGEELSSVKDSTRTSYGTLSFEENNDTSVTDPKYTGDNRVKILRLKDGEKYDIKISGNGKGTMNYTVGFMDENGKYADFRNFENINVTSSSEIAATANSGDNTKLKIDEDGDGRYEQEYVAGPNENGKIVSKVPIYFGIFIIIIAVCVAFVSFIILLWQMRKRKILRAYYGM